MRYSTITIGQMAEALTDAGVTSLAVVRYGGQPKGKPPWVAMVRIGDSRVEARGLSMGQALARLLEALGVPEPGAEVRDVG